MFGRAQAKKWPVARIAEIFPSHHGHFDDETQKPRFWPLFLKTGPEESPDLNTIGPDPQNGPNFMVVRDRNDEN